MFEWLLAREKHVKIGLIHPLTKGLCGKSVLKNGSHAQIPSCIIKRKCPSRGGCRRYIVTPVFPDFFKEHEISTLRPRRNSVFDEA